MARPRTEASGILQRLRQPVRPVHDLRDPRVDAGIDRAGDQRRGTAGQPDGEQVDGRRRTFQKQRDLGRLVGRHLEHPREVVAPARRDHRELATGIHDGTGDRGQHPVAADRDDHAAVGDGSLDQVRYDGRRGRVADLGVGAGLPQPPGERDDDLRRRAATRVRVDEEGERPVLSGHGIRTPGLRIPVGSSSRFTARSTATPTSPISGASQSRWSVPTAW